MPVLAHHLGYSATEIPVSHRPREYGRSRYGLERYLRGFFDLLTVAFMGRYRYRPLHLFGGSAYCSAAPASRSSSISPRSSSAARGSGIGRC